MIYAMEDLCGYKIIESFTMDDLFHIPEENDKKIA